MFSSRCENAFCNALCMHLCARLSRGSGCSGSREWQNRVKCLTAGVATQSSQGPELSGGPQLGESMSDVGMAVGFGVQAAKKHISCIRGLSRFIFLWSKSSSVFSLVELKVLLSTLRVFARSQIEKFSLSFHWRSTAMQCKGERRPVICSVFKPL